MVERILDIKGLDVEFVTPGGNYKVIRGLDLFVNKGETIAIVGESGCGKSITAQAVMRLLPPDAARITGGTVQFKGKDLCKLTEKEMEEIRGRQVGMIFQDPFSALNPTMPVGKQIIEALEQLDMPAGTARQKCIEIMRSVGISQPEKRINNYPHEFSGGMRQRVLIGITLACQPQLLLADEPTTALDVTIQAQIAVLLKELKVRDDISVILITHDLGLVAGMCSRVVVMYAGQVVEEGLADDIFYTPAHPYTRGLLSCIPGQDLTGETELNFISGRSPDLWARPQGCAFWPRCREAMKICALKEPYPVKISGSHRSRCWLSHLHSREVAVSCE